MIFMHLKSGSLLEFMNCHDGKVMLVDDLIISFFSEENFTERFEFIGFI